MAFPVTDDAAACPRWYAVRVRSNREKRVEKALIEAGFLAFLPCYKTVSQWSDRVQTIERPLFPGYVFARLVAAQIADVLRLAGVVNLLPSNLAPSPVSDLEINSLRLAANAGIPLVPCVAYTTGDAVTVETGPLAGAYGVVVRFGAQRRLVISMTLLQRSVFVELDASALIKDKS